jgi:hypothetical protein
MDHIVCVVLCMASFIPHYVCEFLLLCSCSLLLLIVLIFYCGIIAQFIHSAVDSHLSGFRFCAIMNSVTKNNHVYMLLCW